MRHQNFDAGQGRAVCSYNLTAGFRGRLGSERRHVESFIGSARILSFGRCSRGVPGGSSGEGFCRPPKATFFNATYRQTTEMSREAPSTRLGKKQAFTREEALT